MQAEVYGVTILNAIENKEPTRWLLLIALVFIVLTGIGFLISIIEDKVNTKLLVKDYCCEDKELKKKIQKRIKTTDFISSITAVISVILVPLCVLFFFASFIFSSPNGEYRYQVTIDESVNFQEFNEHYRIISQQGDLYTIEPRTNNLPSLNQ